MEPKNLSQVLKRSILRKAEKIASGYEIKIEPSEKYGYIGTAFEFPTLHGRGKTREECIRSTSEMLTVSVATMLDVGGTPPKPGTQFRNHQVNVRVSQWEKYWLSKAAKHNGYRGAADFMRSIAIDTVKSTFNL